MLTQSDLLPLWEAGRSLHPLDQGVLALAAAFPDADQPIADWPLGRRNAALALVRDRMFAGPLRGWVACPECGEKMEFEFDSGTLAAQEQDALERIFYAEAQFRLPTSRDLAAVAAAAPPETAALALLQRCCVKDEATARSWSSQDVDAVSELLAAADPLADVSLSFVCPVCAHSFEESLDLAAHLWSEIDARVRRLLLDVHRLARAYGWSEREILDLSPARRALYVGMVSA